MAIGYYRTVYRMHAPPAAGSIPLAIAPANSGGVFRKVSIGFGTAHVIGISIDKNLSIAC
jgi:hypothetical protein